MRPGPAGRLSRVLVGCHPRRWRDRYGEEMLDVLDQHRPTARTVVNLWASAAALLSYDIGHRAPWDWRVSLYTWTKGVAAGA